MPLLTEQEAWELDKQLTETTPELTEVEGPFIKKYRESMMVALDTLSANYVKSVPTGTHKTPTEIIGELVQEKIAAANTDMALVN
ncbi:MAG: hypothetical protein LBQ93_07960 [Treponema sp.]|nr:hypothetical protein [Treponema sp.]